VQDDARLELSDVDYVDFWLHCVHAFTASYCAGGAGARAAGALGGTPAAAAAVGRLCPAVFVVGTNRASLHDDVDQQLKLVSLGSRVFY